MYEYKKCSCRYFQKLKKQIPDIEFRQINDTDIPDFVILEGSKPIGLIKFIKPDYIEWFEIFKEYRNQRMGKKVIEFTLNELKDDIRFIYVKPFEEAEGFWKKCGFIDSPNNVGMLIYQF